MIESPIKHSNLRIRSFLWAYIATLLLHLVFDGLSARAEEDGAQPLVWNRFLTNWQVLGPFPKDSESSSGLDTEFIREANLRAGRVGFYQNKLYTWQPWERSAIDFRGAFNVRGSSGNNVVAYAYTEVFSPTDQPAVLGLAHDDGVVAWVNGIEVARKDIYTAAILDHTVGETQLKAGVNTVLMKIGQGTDGWHAAARFRPAGFDDPLLSFSLQPDNSFLRLPSVHIDLLDDSGQIISSHQCSGGRKSWPGISGYYAVYAAKPDRTPANVRFSIADEGMSLQQPLFAWNRAAKGNVTLKLQSERPLMMRVVDSRTRQPIAGAAVWENKIMAAELSDNAGNIAIADFNVMANNCWIAADGYVTNQQNLRWPWPDIQQIELIPGGQTVSGTITTTTGEPISGAKVEAGLYYAYQPVVTTDEDGRFAFRSLPAGTTRLSPVITARGFVKKSFRYSLETESANEVTWVMEPGATISGLVTNKDTGQPVAGVTITAGTDRFGGGDDSAPVAITDADGRYELFGVEPGTNLLHAFSDNHAPAMQSVTSTVGRDTTVDFQIAEGQPVSGVIVDSDGMPIPQVWLVTDTWNGARMFKRETRTDDAGRFTLVHMPETEVEVDVLKQGFISQRNVRMKGGDTIDLTLKPEMTHLITIRDSNNQVIPELSITKGYQWDGNSTYSWSSSQWETERYYDKLTGTMRIVIDEPQNYDVAYRFRANGFSEELVKLPRNADAGENFDVRLKPASTFAGRVVDADTGEPLPGIVVALVTNEDRLYSNYVEYHSPWEYLQASRHTGPTATSGTDGTFRLATPRKRMKEVGEGSETNAEPPVAAAPQSPQSIDAGLVLISEDHGFQFLGSLTASMIAAAKESAEPLEVALPKPGVIEGCVLVGGKPVRNAIVHIEWSPLAAAKDTWNGSFGSGGQKTCDAVGQFRFSNLGPGQYRISRVFSYDRPGGGGTSMYLSSEEVTLEPGDHVVQNMERPAGLRLSGVVRNPDGAVLPSTLVVVHPRGSNDRIEAMLTNSEGRFSFEHLAAGSYELKAQHDIATGRYAQVTDFQGSVEVDLSASVDDVVIETTGTGTN